MSDAPRILAIGAHAADVEFTSGATLLKHARAGWEPHILHLTLGEKGSATLSAQEYGEQKRAEALAAAEALRATAHVLPFRDAELTVCGEVAREMALVLRRVQPQVVITHWRESIHADHTAAHHLTHRALFMAQNRHFGLEGLPRMPWARVYYAENWEDPEGFRPYVYVDVSEEFDDWARAFACYAIGRGEGGYPYWDRYQAQARIRGIEVQVNYAQAFGVDDSALRQRRATL